MTVPIAGQPSQGAPILQQLPSTSLAGATYTIADTTVYAPIYGGPLKRAGFVEVAVQFITAIGGITLKRFQTDGTQADLDSQIAAYLADQNAGPPVNEIAQGAIYSVAMDGVTIALVTAGSVVAQ